MLYKVFFEDGKPAKAEEFNPAEVNFYSGEYLNNGGRLIYIWRIVDAVSPEKAIEHAEE